MYQKKKTSKSLKLCWYWIPFQQGYALRLSFGGWKYRNPTVKSSCHLWPCSLALGSVFLRGLWWALRMAFSRHSSAPRKSTLTGFMVHYLLWEEESSSMHNHATAIFFHHHLPLKHHSGTPSPSELFKGDNPLGHRQTSNSHTWCNWLGELSSARVGQSGI